MPALQDAAYGHGASVLVSGAGSQGSKYSCNIKRADRGEKSCHGQDCGFEHPVYLKLKIVNEKKGRIILHPAGERHVH